MDGLHRVNGVELNVVDTASGGSTVVFLHYWGGSARTWRPVVDMLRDAHRCIAIDFRGWGRSSKAGDDFTLATLADDVLAVVRELGLKDFSLVGHSMGGKVAQLVAARHPARLRRLILMAPAPPTPLDVPAEQRRDYVALYESRAGVETAIGNMVALPLSDAHRAQVIEDSMLGSPSARRAWPEAGMIEDISDAAKTITVPVHVVVGAEDRVETEASLRAAFAAVVPDVTYAVLPEVGHLAPLEAPAEVAAAIRATAGA